MKREGKVTIREGVEEEEEKRKGGRRKVHMRTGERRQQKESATREEQLAKNVEEGRSRKQERRQTKIKY